MEGTGWCAAVALFAFLCLAKCAKKKRPTTNANVPVSVQGPEQAKGCGVSERREDGTGTTGKSDDNTWSLAADEPPIVRPYFPRNSKPSAREKKEADADDESMALSKTGSMVKSKRSSTSWSGTGEEGKKSSATMLTEGEADDRALSDYDTHEGRAAGAGKVPEIPESSFVARVEDRKPLRFSNRGRVRPVPRDQTAPWDIDRNRPKADPEGYLHVIRTIQEKGGWVIDRNARGSRKNPSYVFVPPQPATPASLNHKEKKAPDKPAS